VPKVCPKISKNIETHQNPEGLENGWFSKKSFVFCVLCFSAASHTR